TAAPTASVQRSQADLISGGFFQRRGAGAAATFTITAPSFLFVPAKAGTPPSLKRNLVSRLRGDERRRKLPPSRQACQAGAVGASGSGRGSSNGTTLSASASVESSSTLRIVADQSSSP